MDNQGYAAAEGDAKMDTVRVTAQEAVSHTTGENYESDSGTAALNNNSLYDNKSFCPDASDDRDRDSNKNTDSFNETYMTKDESKNDVDADHDSCAGKEIKCDVETNDMHPHKPADFDSNKTDRGIKESESEAIENRDDVNIHNKTSEKAETTINISDSSSQTNSTHLDLENNSGNGKTSKESSQQKDNGLNMSEAGNERCSGESQLKDKTSRDSESMEEANIQDKEVIPNKEWNSVTKVPTSVSRHNKESGSTVSNGDARVNRENKDLILNVNDLQTTKAQVEDDVDNEALLEQTPSNGNPKVHVDRALFSQKQFDENYESGSRPSPSLKEVVLKKVSKCMCSGVCVKNFFVSMFPFLGIMRNYNIRQDLSGDIVSGLTVGIMHIPQGMAYGMLTTLPPVYGLYMSFFPVLIYFFFGSSKHISIGTFAVACLMIGSTVSKGYDAIAPTLATSAPALVIPTPTPMENMTISENATSIPIMSSEEDAMSQEELTIRLQFAMSVTFLVGIVQLVMGVCRLGFITVYLSDPLISGFTTGAACHVFTSQIKHVFGIKTARYSGAFKLIYTYKEFFQYIPHTNSITLITSILCIVILYSVSRFINQNPKLKPKMFMPVPIELIVVVLGTLISYLVDLEGRYDVVIVNDIPTGLPVPNTYAFSHIGDVVSDAIALAIVIFAISISMGKLLAKKHDYEVDANQELIAFGISTVFSSFFSSCAPSASLSRSLIQERVGGKTQLAGVVSCCLLLVVLLAIGPYFRTLPNCILGASIIVALEGLFQQVFDLPKLWHVSKIDFCVLASIIIVALRGMFLQVLDLKKLWSVSIIDFMVWIVAFLATVVLDVDLGLAVAVIFAILTVVCRSQRPYACVLGQMGGTDIYRDINIYHEAREIPGLKIFRFEQSLFFVNTEHFRNCLYKRTVNPRDLKKIQMKQEAKELGLKPTLKPVEDGANHHVEEEVVLATGLSTPNIAVRHDVINLEVRVGGHQEKGPAKPKPKPKPENPPGLDFHTIILDCSSWSFVDSMAVKVLTAVIGEYQNIGVKICLANCKGGIRDMFERTRFYETLDHSRIYVSIHDAVVHSLHLESPAPTPSISTSSSERRIVPRRPISPRVNYIDEGSDKGGQREDASLISDTSDL